MRSRKLFRNFSLLVNFGAWQNIKIGNKMLKMQEYVFPVNWTK